MNKVALLIPHYNNPKGLLKSILSIEKEENIDVFLVDDGSKLALFDQDEVMNSFKANGKIYFKYLDKNCGIENALNIGLDWIKESQNYVFVARLDCGDVCLNKRFYLQEKFLNENPEVMLVGANIICTDTEGNKLYDLVYPEKSDEIRKKMYINSMFSHPCTMYRLKVIDEIGKYPTTYKAAEDYAYFFKMVRKYKTHNLQDFLLKYEINPTGISQTKRKAQVMGRIKIVLDNFYFGFWPIYGIIRNIALYIIPNKLILKIKEIIK